MQPHQPLTHHHAHRLFHISLGLCFAFMALIMLMGLMVVWLGHADPPPVSHDVTITATVSGITPGPIDNGGGPAPVPPGGTPSITIVAEPQGVIPQAGGMYIFVDRTPTFSGHTSVPGGLIFIYINGTQSLNSTAVADGNGDWYWQVPQKLPLGTYGISAVVYNPGDFTKYGKATANFAVETNVAQPGNNGNSGGSAGGGQPGQPNQPGQPGTPVVVPVPVLPGSQLFGVFFHILPEYKHITVGGKVLGQLTLVNKFTDKEVQNQEIDYQVTAADGTVVMQSKDTVTFAKVANFIKTFMTAKGTKPGRYTVTVTATYNGVVSTASDSFLLQEIIPPPASPEEINGPMVLWGALFGLLLLFFFLVLVAYYQVRLVSRHIREHNDRYHNDMVVPIVPAMTDDTKQDDKKAQ